MTVRIRMEALLEDRRRRRSRDTIRLKPQDQVVSPKRKDHPDIRKHKDFIPGVPRKKGRRPRTDTRVMDFE